MALQIVKRRVEPFSSAKLWSKFKRQWSTMELAQLTPEAIINEKVKEACITRLKHIKMTKKSDGDPSQAAVLVPLCVHNGKVGLLYTLRSEKVGMNRRQVSFPGGKKDRDDATLEDTALRETFEELSIPQDTVSVWGCGNFIHRKDVMVLPVIGFIGEVDPKSLNINTHEVEEAFVQPLEKLCDPALCRYTQFRNNYTLPTYLGGNHKIWGLTAAITHMVMCALLPGIYKHKLAYLKPIAGAAHDDSFTVATVVDDYEAKSK